MARTAQALPLPAFRKAEAEIGGSAAHSERCELIALDGFPIVRPGGDVAAIIVDAVARMGLALRDFDILVIAQKIVSKAEGRLSDLAQIDPSPEAIELAERTGKAPALCEAILGESNAILRAKHGVVICEHRSGHVMANAGIDHSNTDGSGDGTVVLLPNDADASAEAIRKRLAAHYGAEIGVIISDSLGRAWRLGTVGHAIGAAGIPSIIDRRGTADLNGRPLEVTMIGFADAVAAAGVLLMGEGDEGRPVVLVRGLKWAAPVLPAKALLRPIEDDMFR